MVPDGDGWVTSESRRARRERRRRELPPRCPVPADLRGRCFNCFSTRHTAVVCRSRPRCFFCGGLGHLSGACPSRLPACRQLVWRPKVVEAARSAAMHSPANSEGEREHKRKRRRRRPHRARAVSSTGNVEEAPGDEGNTSPPPPPPPQAPAVGAMQAGAADAPPVPRRVLDRSSRIARSEDDLRRALIVNVVGEPMVGRAELIRATIALRFEIDEARLTLLPLGPSSFLLILPNEELAATVYNGGRPIITTTARLHIMRWTRFSQATAASLLVAVEVELRGILAHAWDLATAEVLLDELCWIEGGHPSNEDRRDMFLLKAWCSDPARLPSEMVLEIVEPPSASGLGVRTLTYPISVSVRSLDQPRSSPGRPPSPPPEDEDREPRRRRKFSSSPSPSSLAPAAERGGPSTFVAGRASVHARLGPRVREAMCCHPAPHSDDPGNCSQTVDIEDRAAMHADNEALQGPKACTAGTEATEPAACGDVTVCSGSLPEGSCMRSDEESADSAVGAGEDLDVGHVPDVGQASAPPYVLPDGLDADGPRVEVLLDLPGGSGPHTLPSLIGLEVESPVGGPVNLVSGGPVTADPGILKGATGAAAYSTLLLPLSPRPRPAGSCSPQLPSAASHVAPSAPQLVRRQHQITKVYSCRRARRRAAALAPPPSPSSPATEFIKKLSKSPGGILPIPHISKRRKKKLEPPSKGPRRSCRIVGLPATPAEVCPPHLKKRVMRALDLNVEDEREQISPQMLEEYVLRLKHPLTSAHIMALAALFGWNLPDAAPGSNLVECRV